MNEESNRRGEPELLEKLHDLMDSLDKLGSHKQEGLEYVRESLLTVCVICEYRPKCEFAFDLYNIDVEPFIDCLAAK